MMSLMKSDLKVEIIGLLENQRQELLTEIKDLGREIKRIKKSGTMMEAASECEGFYNRMDGMIEDFEEEWQDWIKQK